MLFEQQIDVRPIQRMVSEFVIYVGLFAVDPSWSVITNNFGRLVVTCLGPACFFFNINFGV